MSRHSNMKTCLTCPFVWILMSSGGQGATFCGCCDLLIMGLCCCTVSSSLYPPPPPDSSTSSPTTFWRLSDSMCLNLRFSSRTRSTSIKSCCICSVLKINDTFVNEMYHGCPRETTHEHCQAWLSFPKKSFDTRVTAFDKFHISMHGVSLKCIRMTHSREAKVSNAFFAIVSGKPTRPIKAVELSPWHRGCQLKKKWEQNYKME